VRAHIVGGQFQSDKYPTCPPGKVPLSVKDVTAQDLLWEYAQRRRSVDAEFADDLEWALRDAGYKKEDGKIFCTCGSDREASVPDPRLRWRHSSQCLHSLSAEDRRAVELARIEWRRDETTANRMDAPEGPQCGCGKPSAHESGWCGTECEAKFGETVILVRDPESIVTVIFGYPNGLFDSIRFISDRGLDATFIQIANRMRALGVEWVWCDE
jgi:hypothetical protein